MQPVLLWSGAWHSSRGLRLLKLRACFIMVDPLLIMPHYFMWLITGDSSSAGLG